MTKRDHYDVLSDLVHDLRKYMAVGDAFTIALDLYGLKVLADCEEYFTEKGLNVPARQYWGDLRSAFEGVGKTFGEVLEELSRFQTLKHLRPDPRLIEPIPEQELGKAVRVIDSMILGINRPEEFELFIGDTTERALANLSDLGRGDYFTPSRINELAVDILSPHLAAEVYDPFCGVGGGLWNTHKTLAYRQFSKRQDDLRLSGEYQADDLRLYGQDINPLALRYCTWNLITHGISNFQLEAGNTLLSPAFIDPETQKLKKFDAILSAIPTNISLPEGFGKGDPHHRFRYGDVNPRRAEFAAIQHILASLKSGGRAVTLVSSPLLYRNTDKDIRRSLSRADLVRTCISLPPGALYPSSSASFSFIVLEPEKAPSLSNKIQFVDTSTIDTSGIRSSQRGALLDAISSPILKALREPEGTSELSVLASLDELERNDFSYLPSLYTPTEELPRKDSQVLFDRVLEAEAKTRETARRFEAAVAGVRILE